MLGQRGGGEHLLDRLNTGDRFFREGKTKGNGAGEFAVDVHGAAAHALHDTSLFEWTATEFREYDGLPWREVFEDTEDLDLEFLDLVPVKDSPSHTLQPRTDVPEREEVLRPTESGATEKKEEKYRLRVYETGSRRPKTGQLAHISHCSACWFAVYRCD